MRRILTTSLLVPFLPLVVWAQDCASGRYHTPNLFADVTVTTAVPFGSNTGVAGGTQTLYLDVYRPAGDTATDRAVMVVAFGGSFIQGSRADVAPICQALARMGYVAVAPDYRVGLFWPVNEQNTTLAVMRGAHDMKACVRFLRRSVAEDGNPYGIDPERIILGGVSAGAISAIHATYMDQESEIPGVVAATVAQMGGVEGNSGNPGYTSKPFACFSFSGAIGDTLWIEPGDVPLASVHETGDGVVPYGTQQVSVIGIPTGLMASGSHDIHVRCDNIGVANCFKSYNANAHVGYLQTDAANAIAFVAQFASRLVCDLEFGCEAMTTDVAAVEAPTIGVHPNPTTGPLHIELPAAGSVRLFNMNGRVVWEQGLQAGAQWIHLDGLPGGVYLLRTEPGAAVRVVIMDQQ